MEDGVPQERNGAAETQPEEVWLPGEKGCRLLYSIPQRVQVPKYYQKPFRVWILGPKTLLFGYSDPLGTCSKEP